MTPEDIIAAMERAASQLRAQSSKPDHVFIPVEFFDAPGMQDALIEAKRLGLAHVHPQAGALVESKSRRLHPAAMLVTPKLGGLAG